MRNDDIITIALIALVVVLSFSIGVVVGKESQAPMCIPSQKLHVPQVGDCYVFTPGNYYPMGVKAK